MLDRRVTSTCAKSRISCSALFTPSLGRASHTSNMQTCRIYRFSNWIFGGGVTCTQKQDEGKALNIDIWTGGGGDRTPLRARVATGQPPLSPSSVHHQRAVVKERNEVRNRMLRAGGWGQCLHRTYSGRFMGEACHPDKQRSGSMGWRLCLCRCYL